jgi:hypothetical protein
MRGSVVVKWVLKIPEEALLILANEKGEAR